VQNPAPTADEKVCPPRERSSLRYVYVVFWILMMGNVLKLRRYREGGGL